MNQNSLFWLTVIPYEQRFISWRLFCEHDPAWTYYRTEITGDEGFYEFYHREVIGAFHPNQSADDGEGVRLYDEQSIREASAKIEDILMHQENSHE